MIIFQIVGWKLLDVFDGTDPNGMLLNVEMLEMNYESRGNWQHLFVLKKL